MVIKLEPLKCPKCGSVLHGKAPDLIYVCENCGTFVYAPTGKEINGKILEFELEGKNRYYMPFLTYDTKVEIYHEEVRGILTEKGRGGEWLTYVPGWNELPAEETVRMGKMLSSNPPEAVEIDNFRNVPRIPLGVTIEEGEKLTEFIFLSYEVERRGILQKIDYSFAAEFKEVVYVPVIYDGYYYPAFRKYRRR